MKRVLQLAFFLTFFALASCQWLVSCGSHDDAFSDKDLLTADAAKLKSTVVTAHLEEPIEYGKNVLWCSTFQLAWNEMCAALGEDIHMADEPPMVAALNKKVATRKDLDEESFVALAGRVRDGIMEQIPKALDQKFKGIVSPRLLPTAPPPGARALVMYAYLFKNLEFPTPFEKIEDPLLFEGTDVPCFGMGKYKSAHLNMYEQVAILDYKGWDDFIIELKTKSAGDRVILAKVAPGKTLEATVRDVQKRIADVEPEAPATGDTLSIPKLNFDVLRNYKELVGLPLRAANPKMNGYSFFWAAQDTRFQLDERGVKLRSEGTGGIGCSAPPGPQHKMIFDEPFLIMLSRVDAKTPYFALWVDNAELLVKK